jgi:hypothetical protein
MCENLLETCLYHLVGITEPMFKRLSATYDTSCIFLFSYRLCNNLFFSLIIIIIIICVPILRFISAYNRTVPHYKKFARLETNFRAYGAFIVDKTI